LLIAKNAEIQGLVENNAKIKSTYEGQAAAYRRTIDALERQLGEEEQSREGEFRAIREKY
jgi:hypothetical protein